MCSLPWPDHSRLRSENSPNDWKFTEDEHITNFISSDTMQHNYATFHEISVLEKHEYTKNMQNLEMP